MMFLTPMTHRTAPVFSDLFRDFDRMEKAFFEHEPSVFATDIFDTGDSYRLDMELPGFKKEEIKVSLEGKYLTVTAEHAEADEKEDSVRYLRRERRTGSVTRSFTLSGIDTEAIDVVHENGVLSIILPKTKPIKPEVKEFEIR